MECRHCGSTRLRKKGMRNNLRRYYCNDCKKYFTEKNPAFNQDGQSRKKEIYGGYKPRRAWEQRTKDGEIVVLHSAEYDVMMENFDKFEKSTIGLYKEIIKDINPISIKKEKIDEPIAVRIYTSDKHIGADTRNAIYGNKYNAKVAKSRIEETLDCLKQLKDVYGHFDLIAFDDLGDGVDGINRQTARKQHQLDQNLESEEQFDAYVTIHKKIFDTIIENNFANNYRYTVCANDNHNGFFMYITARALEEYLNARYPEIKTDVSKKFIFNQSYGIHRFVFTHGKDDRYLKYGFPKILNEKIEKYVNDYIDYHGLNKHLEYAQEKACIHLIKGDLHTSNEQFGARFRYKNIMSVYGSSTYIQHNYGVGYNGFEFEIFYKNKPKYISGKNFYF